MTQIQYIQGDATKPQASGNKIIAHICNDIGGWGKGFVLAISKRWPQPEQEYRQWYQHRAGNDFALGSLQLVQVEPDIYVANLIGQKGLKKSVSQGVPIRYEAVQDCLEKLAVQAEGLQASVHMPRIGCGLAGGSWDRIEPIIQETLIKNNIEVTVYDF